MRMGGSRGGTGGLDPPPLKNHNHIGFPSNTGPDPLKKSQGYQANIRCWAINGTTVKRHLNGVCWRADVGPRMVVFGSSLPLSTNKKNVDKVGPPLAKLSGSVQDALTRLSLHCEKN